MILETATNASDMEETIDSCFIKGMLLGASKGGKTTSAITLPATKEKPLLLIDTDLRASSVLGAENLKILTIKSDPSKPEKAWMDLRTLKGELWALARKPEPFPYSGVINDGLSSLNRMAMDYTLTLRTKEGKEVGTGLSGGPAQPHYAPQMYELALYINSMLPLPCHYILTGHFDLFENKEDNTLHYWPKMYGKTRTEVASWFNETYENYSKTSQDGKVKYYWATVGSGRKDFLGSSLNKQGKIWTSPFEIDLDKKPQGFGKLLELRFKGGEKGSTEGLT